MSLYGGNYSGGNLDMSLTPTYYQADDGQWYAAGTGPAYETTSPDSGTTASADPSPTYDPVAPAPDLGQTTVIGSAPLDSSSLDASYVGAGATAAGDYTATSSPAPAPAPAPPAGQGGGLPFWLAIGAALLWGLA